MNRAHAEAERSSQSAAASANEAGIVTVMNNDGSIVACQGVLTRPFDIEAWAVRTIERVEVGQRVEDTRVELKSGSQDPKRMAREIAGHANVARGDPILWLIGVGEWWPVIGEKVARHNPYVMRHYDHLRKYARE